MSMPQASHEEASRREKAVQSEEIENGMKEERGRREDESHAKKLGVLALTRDLSWSLYDDC